MQQPVDKRACISHVLYVILVNPKPGPAVTEKVIKVAVALDPGSVAVAGLGGEQSRDDLFETGFFSFGDHSVFMSRKSREKEVKR